MTDRQEGANVLFFTFINPATMDVPAAFQKLGTSSHHLHDSNNDINDNDDEDDDNDKQTNMMVMTDSLFSAATRGTGVEGAVPADTLIIFAIGG